MVRSEYKRRHESFGRSISHSGSQEGKEIDGHTCRILVTEEAPDQDLAARPVVAAKRNGEG